MTHVARERKTLRAMLRIYCRDQHQTRKGLCPECQELWGYAMERLERCPFMPDKPVCQRCTVHCYKTSMRERVRQVMRYAGPRLWKSHPLMALRHILTRMLVKPR